jgi:hypothetical protein
MPTSTEPKTKFQQLVKSIEGSNKKFEKASKAAKIVMVAKDVLAMLAARRIRAISGLYISQGGVPEESIVGLKDMSELLKLPVLPPCEVCAIGAAMFATTLRLDNVPITPDHFSSNHSTSAFYATEASAASGSGLSAAMSQRARCVFPDYLLRCMEYVFEKRECGYTQKSDSSRLVAIYKNLVENKGNSFTNCKTGTLLWTE